MITYEHALAAFKQRSYELGKPWIDCEEQADCLKRLILWAIRSDEYTGRLSAGIRLRGHRDSGKTHAMRCLLGMLNKIHYQDRYSQSAFRIEACQDMVSRYNIEGEEALIEMAKLDRVMYDDLGEEREGNFMGKHCNVMLEVIGRQYRMMQDRPMLTLCTTNLPDEKADAARYGERISTRMQEMWDTIVWKGPKEGFRKKTQPLGWMWPGSPQELEFKRIERERQEAEWRANAERQRLADEARERQRAETARLAREEVLRKAAVGLEDIRMGSLLNLWRMTPDKDLKAMYGAEVSRRTKSPSKAVEEFLTTPDPDYKPSGPVVLQLHPETPTPEEPEQGQTFPVVTAKPASNA